MLAAYFQAFAVSPDQSRGFINVDELLPQVSIEQAAAFYGVPLALAGTVGEVRTRCFFNCGKSTETGERAIAINRDQPVTRWRCHQYGCGKGGNLISACDLLKPGTNMGGRPRGERFKAIARDLKAMVEGVLTSSELDTSAAPQPPSSEATDVREKQDDVSLVNVPLKDSENERARGLVSLHEKLITDPADMSPPAASYMRRRPFLSQEVCRQWQLGYMPRSAGSTLRGLIVYPIRNEAGEVLAWMGRDPAFEQKHAAWLAGGRQGKEPLKFRIPKNFHRGLELFGQDRYRAQISEQIIAIDDADAPLPRLLETREAFTRLGVIVTEGANDVIRLWTLNVPSLGLLSNTATAAQRERIADLAHEHADGRVSLLMDTDVEGEQGMRQVAWELLQERCRVQLLWSRTLFGGKYRDRQPEELSREEWEMLAT